MAQTISGSHSAVTLEWHCPHLHPARSPGPGMRLGGFQGSGWHLQTGGKSAPQPPVLQLTHLPILHEEDVQWVQGAEVEDVDVVFHRDLGRKDTGTSTPPLTYSRRVVPKASIPSYPIPPSVQGEMGELPGLHPLSRLLPAPSWEPQLHRLPPALGHCEQMLGPGSALPLAARILLGRGSGLHAAGCQIGVRLSSDSRGDELNVSSLPVPAVTPPSGSLPPWEVPCSPPGGC